MRLHVEIAGDGPDLVLLHGWGLNSAIWGELATTLARTHRVHCLDLPGHGRSGWNPGATGLDEFVRAVAPYVPRDAAVLGWSLGGIVALGLARRLPERVARLVLVSTTPRFVAGADWTPAMSPQVLANFAAHLRADYRATVQDFLALQVRGEERELATLRELRHRLQAGGMPDPVALEAGLGILRTTDLVALLPGIAQPTLVVSGAYDRITPPGAGEYLARMIPDAEFMLIDRAGHAPFISHAGEFVPRLEAFLNRGRQPRAAAGGTP